MGPKKEDRKRVIVSQAKKNKERGRVRKEITRPTNGIGRKVRVKQAERNKGRVQVRKTAIRPKKLCARRVGVNQYIRKNVN